MYLPASKNNKIRHCTLAGGSKCPITARQYGEVVLPDAIPAKVGFLNWVVICHWPEKEGMAHFLPSWYKFY